MSRQNIPHFCDYCSNEMYDKNRQMVRCSLIEDSYKFKTSGEQQKHCPLFTIFKPEKEK